MNIINDMAVPNSNLNFKRKQMPQKLKSIVSDGSSKMKHSIRNWMMASVFLLPTLQGCAPTTINDDNTQLVENIRFNPERQIYQNFKQKHAKALTYVINNNEDVRTKVDKIEMKSSFILDRLTYDGRIIITFKDGSYKLYASRDNGRKITLEQRYNINPKYAIFLNRDGTFNIEYFGDMVIARNTPNSVGKAYQECKFYRFDKNGNVILPCDNAPKIMQDLDSIKLFDNQNDLKMILSNVISAKGFNSVDYGCDGECTNIYLENDTMNYKIQLRNDNGVLYGTVNKVCGTDSQIYTFKMTNESTKQNKRVVIVKQRIISDIDGDNIQAKNISESYTHTRVNDYAVARSGGIFSHGVAMLPTDVETFTKEYLSEQAEVVIYTLDDKGDLKENSISLNSDYQTIKSTLE